VVRRPIEESDPEPTLFVMKHYAYRAWHTNLPLTPDGVWRFYDGRAGMERRIREIREDYTLSKIPTRAFEANALYLEVVRLAYNLVTAFQRTCLPPEWQGLNALFDDSPGKAILTVEFKCARLHHHGA
jgi:Transposase DDE domain group 1